jgi:hypothetical protein
VSIEAKDVSVVIPTRGNVPMDEIIQSLEAADCRVMCRGHLANLTLDNVMVEHKHPEFV